MHKSKNHHSNDMHVVTQQKHREEARCTLDSFTVHVLSFSFFFSFSSKCRFLTYAIPWRDGGLVGGDGFLFCSAM